MHGPRMQAARVNTRARGAAAAAAARSAHRMDGAAGGRLSRIVRAIQAVMSASTVGHRYDMIPSDDMI
jgi:hypothetical protein